MHSPAYESDLDHTPAPSRAMNAALGRRRAESLIAFNEPFVAPAFQFIPGVHRLYNKFSTGRNIFQVHSALEFALSDGIVDFFTQIGMGFVRFACLHLFFPFLHK